MFIDFKFPKLSSESPANRLKSKTPVQFLAKSEILDNKSLSKIIHQKKKFLKINESLASKYFVPDSIKTPNPVSVSPTNSTRPSISKRLWDKELENVNSKFYKNELKLMQVKGKKEDLPGLQQEFFLFKDYVEELCAMYSSFSKELGTCVKRGVIGLAQVFSKVFRKCMISETCKVVETGVKCDEVVVKRKDLRNQGVQTEDQFSDISEDELENLKSLKDRIKSVKMPLVINKLLDLKQAIMDMYTIIPSITEAPDMPPDSYKSLLKLISSQLKPSKKNLNFTESGKKKSQKFKIDQETQIEHFEGPGLGELTEIEQYKIIIEDLKVKSKESEAKIIWLESQILQISQGRSKKRANKHTEVNLDQELFDELKKLNLDSLQKLAQIEFAWEIMTGYKFLYNGAGFKYAKRELRVDNRESIEVKVGETFRNREKIDKESQKTLENFCFKCGNIISDQDLEKEMARVLAKNLEKKRRKEVFDNLYRNSKGCQAVFEDCEKNEEIVEKNEEVQEWGVSGDSHLEKILEFYREKDDKEGICNIFDEEEVKLLSFKVKARLLHIFKDHFSKKCTGMCLHLKWALEIKKKTSGKLYPLKKIML